MNIKDVTSTMLEKARKAYDNTNINKVFSIGFVDGYEIFSAHGLGGKVGVPKKFYIKEDGSVHKMNFEECAYVTNILFP